MQEWLASSWDGWTWNHVAAGLIGAIIQVRPRLAWGFAIGWEAYEGIVRRWWPGEGIFDAESWPNVIVDILAAMVVFHIFHAIILYVRRSLGEPEHSIAASPLDRWSVAHAGSGMALGLAGLTLGGAAAVLALFELGQAYVRRRPLKWLRFKPESWHNSVADIAVGLAGCTFIWLSMRSRLPLLWP